MQGAKYQFRLLLKRVFVLTSMSLLLLFQVSNSYSQGDICIDSEPFSTSTSATFPAGVNSGTGEGGPDYGCLGSEPNPAWYYMRISEAGDIIIRLSSAPSEDIDFILWGPFADPHAPCTAALTGSTIVDCSYSPSSVETIFLPDGEVGEYYILMITNYSNNPCIITAEKIGGEGETDETIINTQATNNSPICNGESLQLFAQTVTGATYAWTGPNGFTSTQQNPIIPLANANQSGNYILRVTLNGVTSQPYETYAVVLNAPSFTIFDEDNVAENTYQICPGEDIVFKVNPFPDFGSAYWNNGSQGINSTPYTTAGTINVTVHNFQGCTATKSVTLQILNETPIAFNINNFCQAELSPILLNNKVTPTGGAFSGTGISLVSGSYYLNPAAITPGGNSTINYTYTDNNTCINNSSHIVTRYATPIVSYNITPAEVCVDAEPININQANPPGGTYTATGLSGTIFDPEIFGAGNFSIGYFFTDSHGCSNSATSSIKVNPLPYVTFAEVPPVCKWNGTGNPMITITQGSGNGATGTGIYGGQNINSLGKFNSSLAVGTYNVYYQFTDNNGCVDAANQQIEIIDGPQAPTTISVENNNYCSDSPPSQIILHCEGTSPNDTYKWYANNYLGSPIGTGKNLSVNAPSVTTTYYVRSETSCGFSTDKNITVTVKPSPVANFTPVNGCQGQEISFSDLSTIPAGGTISSRLWNFGDGATSTTQNINHPYSLPGNYSVTLTVNSNQGCSDTKVGNITINPAPQPPTSISVNTSSYCSNEKPSQITLTCTGGIADTYYWYANNLNGTNIGSSKTLTIASPNVTTKYYVRSESSLGCGNSSSLNTTVTVNQSPAALFNLSNQCQGVQTTILNSSTTPNPTNTTWSWDFGDGGVSSDKNPTHTFNNVGQTTIILNATTPAGCSDDYSKVIEIFDAPIPPGSISANISEFCSNNNPGVINLNCTGSDENYKWYQGAVGGSSIGSSNSIAVSAPTTTTEYFVRSESQNCGNSPALNLTIEVNPSPIASFSVSNICQGENISIINSSSDPENHITSFNWDFGNGVTSTDQTPSYSYTTYGQYEISLQVENNYGCDDTELHTVNIFDNPTAGFLTNDNCFGIETTFTNTSTAPVSDIITNIWTLNGNSYNDNNLNYTFPSEGSYDITLNVATEHGCSNTFNSLINVWPSPISNFDYNNPCHSNVVELTNLSIPSLGSTLGTYLWEFDNGFTSNQEALTYVYPSGGIYEITLTVTDVNGCSHQFSQPNVVVSPEFDVSIDNGIFCLNESGIFEGTPIPDWLPLDDYKWIFPTGTEIHNQDASFIFTEPGSHLVNLVGTLGECTAGKSVVVDVKELPISLFELNGLCINTLSSYTDLSTGDGLNITDWSWDLGNGQNSTLQNPVTQYNLPNEYTVSLSVKDENNCINTSSQSIIINPLPVVNFDPVAPYCEDEEISFQNQSTTNGISLLHSWSFGDGLLSTENSPNHIFTSAGNKTITLQATDQWNCVNSLSKDIYITPDFSLNINSIDICNNTPIDLHGEVIGNILVPENWTWDFYDGNPKSGQNVNYSFPVSGAVNVQLSADLNGCIEVLNQELLINPVPSSNFNYSEVVLYEEVNFTDISTINGPSPLIQWNWEFGDPMSGVDNFATIQNPNHTYDQVGTYQVQLQITDEKGCQNSILNEINVYALPVCDFNWGASCFGNSVQFSDLSSTIEGSITGWSWDFGDPGSPNNSSNTQNPAHTFSAPGNYMVSLTTFAHGSNTISKQVTIHENPISSFSASSPCEGGITVFSDNSQKGDGNIVSWQWNFGDGTISDIPNPNHTYSASGNYNTSLVVVDSYGCTDTEVKLNQVWDNPIANISTNRTCANNLTEFTDISLEGDASIVSWEWDFGDLSSGMDNSSSLQNPQHRFVSNGNYQINLHVIDSKGCENNNDFNLMISPSPNANFLATSLCFGETVNITDNSSTPNGTVTNWNWNLGDGTMSTETNPNHLYSAPGEKNIQLIVTDNLNCYDTLDKSLYITPEFTLNVDYFGLCTNTAANLSGEVVYPSMSPDSWSWLFEDGTTATGQNTVYTFTQGGNHLVELTANKNGCEEVHQQILSVNPCPTANFNYSLVSLDDTVQFIDVSTLNGGPAIMSWSWNFDDVMSGLENFSILQNPKHLFTHLGDFDVTLTVTDANGCSNAITKTLTVNPKPVAGFQWDLSCFGQPVQFEDTSTTSQGFITDWWWNFGDISSGAFNESTAQNPTHIFTAAGVYDVMLVVKAYGFDTIIQQVTIYDGATADFSFNNPCQGDPVNFIDESAIGDAPIESWFWDFADTTSSTDQNPSHVYHFSGNYLVDLTVTDTNGCSSTITKNVTIWQGPTAKFNYYSACVGSLTYFIDKSIADGASFVSWDWSFGDPTSGINNYSTEQNPGHEYTSPGSYEVILIVEDANGCVDSDTVNIIVEPSPVADFTFTSTCFGESITFTDQSFSAGQPIISWYWEFGDGTTSTSANPNHNYNAAGNYNVLLVVETAGGCSNEVVKTVSVFYQPTANFEWSGGIACANDTTHFIDMSIPTGNATINTWIWQFGDSQTSNEQNPSHFYQSPGTYAVNLLITDINGCQHSITKTVVVSEAPVSNFIFDNSSCDLVSFNSTGFDPNGLAITNWFWNFDDSGSGVNNLSSQQNPSHQYINGGTYNVMHIITNASGCTDTTYQVVLMSKPDAEFNYVTNCAGFPVNFTDQSTAQGDPVVSWSWNFSDGNTSTQQNPSHIFANGGSYFVSLSIITAGGCNSQIAHVVDVNSAPTSNFIHTNIHCTSDSIQFTDVSTGSSTILSWEWQFGDGTTSILEDPNHVFMLPGNYLVQLRVTDANGCYGDKNETLTIDQNPSANFNWDIINCDTTFFTDFTNANGTTLIAWAWQFDDVASGVENISFLQNPNHKFTTSSNYNVQLTVTNQHLCTDTLSRVVAYDAQPQPAFSFDTVCFGDSTHFIDITPTNFQTIQGWEWKFGDNVVSHQQNPVHKFLLPGTYNVTLKILNTNFCEDSIVSQVLVRELPIASFSPDSSCFGSSVNFVDESNSNANSIDAWSWDFGDGASATLSNPSHTYATPGTYQVNLNVENNFSCSNTTTKPHYVNALPVVDFSFTNGCLGTITQFSSQATSYLGIETWFWDFDNGSTSNASNPNYTYESAGTYNVKLIVTDFFGCSDSITHPVEVYESPVAAFEALAVCVGDSTQFTNQTIPAGTVWNWSFGDGTTSMLSNPSHLYDNAGTYSVLLEVEDAAGCSSSVVQEVMVNPLPIVSFSWNYTACAGDTVFFNDLSQAIGTDIIGWNWDFGDGTSAILSNPSHVYAETGDTTYNVNLTILTETGCVRSLTQVINITGAPIAAFSFANTTNNGPCVGNQFIFTDESTSQSGNVQEWLWDFGDGTSAMLGDPLHYFSNAGTFAVSLTVTNTTGCQKTVVQDVVVIPLPDIDFNYNSVCLNDTTHFNDSDFVNALSVEEWTYSFGDGASATISNPSHRYINSGNFTVTLQITDTNMCRNQVMHEVLVYELPTVNFTFDTACLFIPSHFTDLSQSTDHELANWNWSFGDGGSALLTNPEYIYPNFGLYTVKLIVSDEWGCTDSLQKLVEVYEPPIAHFTHNDSACAPGLVYFYDSSYHNQGLFINQLLWSIDDFVTNVQNPQYTFPNTNFNYPVSLLVTDEHGCSDTINRTLYIAPELEISFSADTVCAGLETMLVAYSTKPAGAEVQQWTWYFDDGSPQLTTTHDTIYHQFSNDGVYRVELQGKQLGTTCIANARKNVKVWNQPSANFSTEPASCADSTVFQNESLNGEGQFSQFIWYFGDGTSTTIYNPQNPNIKHLYPPYLNSFQASLSVTNEFGCKDSISHIVQRYPCIFVNFESDTNLYCQSKLAVFIDSSIVDETATLVSRFWDFGDGSSFSFDSTIDTVTHFYNQSGTFIITYILTFDVGDNQLSDTARKTITVYPTPLADMELQNVCDGEDALLVSNTNANNSIIQSWTWNFGDGQDTTIFSNEVNNTVYHQFPQNGTYEIQLMAITDLGCRDTAFNQITVHPVPQISFISNNNALCGQGQIILTDTSKIEAGTIVKRAWDFGDRNTAMSTYDTISHIYTRRNLDSDAAEFFTVTLTTTSDSSCISTDSIPQMIAIYALPRVEFTVSPDSVSILDIHQLQLLNNTENGFYYEWLLNDTLLYSDSFEPNVWQDIQDTGFFQIQLLAQSVDGCFDSKSSSFKVYPVPRFFVPNAFSPNGNGLNETFGPVGKYFEEKSYTMKIFTRWGKIVFETKDFYKQWNGKDESTGEMQPIGVYAYLIEITDLDGNVEVIKGFVTLML